jgi:hypothetical protein
MAKPLNLEITQEDIEGAARIVAADGIRVIYQRDMDNYQSPYGAITVLYRRRKGVWTDHTCSPLGLAINRKYRDLGWRRVLFVGDEIIVHHG